VYAPQMQPVPTPVVVRLIGVLDADLIAAFGTLERGLVGTRGGTIVLDVRDIHVLGEAQMDALTSTVAAARAEGRDVRVDARSLPWKRAVKKELSGQPAIDRQLRSAVRRTVIVAHSARPKRR
jgi:anti-anti-sigma regulatory factor